MKEELNILDRLLRSRYFVSHIVVYKIDGHLIWSMFDKHSQIKYPDGRIIKDRWPLPAFIIKPKKK